MYKTRRDPAHRSWRSVAKIPPPAPLRLLPRLLASCPGEDWVTVALFLIAAFYLIFSESFWRGLPF